MSTPGPSTTPVEQPPGRPSRVHRPVLVLAAPTSTAEFETDKFKALPKEEQLIRLKSAHARIRKVLDSKQAPEDKLLLMLGPVRFAAREEKRREMGRGAAWLGERILEVGRKKLVGEGDKGDVEMIDAHLPEEEEFDVVDGKEALLGEDYSLVDSDEAREGDDCGGGYDTLPEVYEDCQGPRGDRKPAEGKGPKKTNMVLRGAGYVNAWLDQTF